MRSARGEGVKAFQSIDFPPAAVEVIIVLPRREESLPSSGAPSHCLQIEIPRWTRLMEFKQDNQTNEITRWPIKAIFQCYLMVFFQTVDFFFLHDWLKRQTKTSLHLRS